MYDVCVCVHFDLWYWYVRWPRPSSSPKLALNFFEAKNWLCDFSLSLVVVVVSAALLLSIALYACWDSNGERTEHKFGFFESICSSSSSSSSGDCASKPANSSCRRYLCNTTWNFKQTFSLLLFAWSVNICSAPGLASFDVIIVHLFAIK